MKMLEDAPKIPDDRPSQKNMKQKMARGKYGKREKQMEDIHFFYKPQGLRGASDHDSIERKRERERLGR